MKFDVITFGSAVVDVFVDTDVAEKHDFISYPVGSKILIKDLKFDLGGGGTNTAVAFSRLGFKTGYIGKLGKDEYAKEILAMLEKENVKFLGKIDKEMSTGFSVILDSREKERTVLTYKGANDFLGFHELKLGKLETKWIYFSSLLEESFETQVKLAEIMKKRNVNLAFNPSAYLIKRKNIRKLLKLTDILILNKEEAEMLVGKKQNLSYELYKLIDSGIVVITDKDKKAIAYDGFKEYFIIPNKIKVVERTGAGDAFASGFVAGQIAGKSIQQSLKLGLMESESVIRYFGAKNNLLRMKLL